MAHSSFGSAPWSPGDNRTRRPPLPAAPRHVPMSMRLFLCTRGASASIGIGFLSFGLFFLALASSPLQWGRDVLSNIDVQRADGTVVAVGHSNVSVNGEQIMGVAADYSAAGRSLRVKSYSGNPDISVGDVVGVRFNASMPTMAVVEGMSAAVVPPWIALLVSIFPLVGGVLFGRGIRRGHRQIQLLARGLEAEGTLVSSEPSGTTVNDEPIMRLDFRFQDEQGDPWPAVAFALDTRRLEDEPTERLLYLPTDPRQAMVIDEIPSWLEISQRGWAAPPSTVSGRMLLKCLAIPAAVVVGIVLSFTMG